MTQRVYINDVGPRDGLQNQASILSPEQRLDLIHALREAGLKSIEAGSFVSPKAVPAMAGAAEIFAGLPEDGASYQALIPNLRGYELARAAGVKKILMVVCATETMNQKNVRASIAEGLKATQDIVVQAKRDGIQTLACVAVAWECPFEGLTDRDAVFGIVQAFFDMGVDEVVVADTIGAAHPESVHELMSTLVGFHGAERLACHFHDTRAMGVANVYAALTAGIRKFDASVGGLGGCPFAPGATGNVATEDVVMMLQQMGYETGINLTKLMAAGQLAGEFLGLQTGGRAHTWRQLQVDKGKL